MEGQLKWEPWKFVSSRMSHYGLFIMQVLASQLHFLANRSAELAVPPFFSPVNCIKIGGHVALLSCRFIYFLFYAKSVSACGGVGRRLRLGLHYH